MIGGVTYSIVARDGKTGCFGVAVQSGVLAVGTRVPAALAGVGAVVVQAGSELAWRESLLGLLGSGVSAAGAVRALATVPGVGEAQFAAVGVEGGAAAFTGGECVGAAGHLVAGAVSAQGNMMASPEVWPAMVAAYESAAGDLADRLVAALVAAEALGGDVRGPQSASALVVGPERGALSTGNADDPAIDLRVDDSRDPVGELRRLLTVARAHRHLIRAWMAGDDDALRLAELRAAVDLAPDDPAALRSAGIGLALRGHLGEAAPLLARVAEVEPRALRWVRVSAERAAHEGNPHAAALLDRVEQHSRVR